MEIKSIGEYLLAEVIFGGDAELAKECEDSEEYVIKKLVRAEERVKQLEEELEATKGYLEDTTKSLKFYEQMAVNIDRECEELAEKFGAKRVTVFERNKAKYRLKEEGKKDEL